MTTSTASPRWNTSTKFLVTLVAVALVGVLLYRFQGIIAPLVMALILAYLLRPAAEFVSRRTGLSWGGTVNLIFLALIVLLLGISTALGVVIEQQAEGLYNTIVEFVQHPPDYLNRWIREPVRIGPFVLDLSTLDLAPLYEQATAYAQSVLAQTGALLTMFFSKAFTVVGWLVFILAISYYLLHDFNSIGTTVDRLAMPGYSNDLQRLRRELGIIWNAFLRGQFLLAAAMGVANIVVLTLLGVRYSLILGLLAGLLEFVPIIGPFIAGAVAVIVALFQGTNWLGLSPLSFAGVVALAAVLLQQLENNLLVPRILGRSLNLHPVLVMVGALIGASLAGILGLLLSAPMMATVKLLSRYTYRKLLDLPPFPEHLPESPPVERHRGWWGALVKRFRGDGAWPDDSARTAGGGPVDDAVVPAAPVPRVEVPPTARLAPKILLVDDDPDILELLDLSLKRAGYEVVTAHDGNDAVRRLAEFRPSLILLDLMMPGGDGYETLRQVRLISDAPVIIVSALSDSREVTRALDSGAVDYLAKPFHPAELVSRVAAVLRRTEAAEAHQP